MLASGSRRKSGRASSAQTLMLAMPSSSMALSSFDDAVLERLAADEADVGMVPGLPDQMLAAAEADLQPDLAHGLREERGQIGQGVASPGIATRGSKSSHSAFWRALGARARRRP